MSDTVPQRTGLAFFGEGFVFDTLALVEFLARAGRAASLQRAEECSITVRRGTAAHRQVPSRRARPVCSSFVAFVASL